MSSPASDPLHCESCAARLAHDQRYCLACGTRRGALPAPVAEMLGSMIERGEPVPARPVPAPTWEREPKLPLGLTMPSPRAVSVAVMGMLGFGVILTSAAAPPVATYAAGAPVLLAVSPSGVNAGGVGGGSDFGGGGSADSSGGGGTEVVTVVQTTTSPAAATGAGGSVSAGGGLSAPPPSSGAGNSGSTTSNGLPPIKHVFLIMLSDAGFKETFGSSDPYLSKTLPSQGKLLYNYYAVAGSGLANGIALMSGQGPTRQTTADCPVYTALTPANTGPHQQVRGDGCVYPASTQTLVGQLAAKKDKWKAYIEGIDAGPSGQPTSCRHPSVGSPDADHVPRDGDPYVTWRNPFVYFTSLTHGNSCQQNDVGLGGLSYDLQNPNTAPAFAYIAPGPCDDGNPQPCNATAQGGVAGADRFLQLVVPEIEQSAAYQDDGLIIVTSDEAPQTGPDADPSACCSTPSYPNLTSASAADPTTSTVTTPTVTTPTVTVPPVTVPPATTTTSATPTTTSTTTSSTTPAPATSLGSGETTPTGGGGQVGMVLISKFVKKNSVDPINYYSHFSLLATLEGLFGLKKLGYAGLSGLPEFGAAVFDGPAAGAAAASACVRSPRTRACRERGGRH